MSRMKKLAGLALAGVLAINGVASQSEARPGYCKEMLSSYADNKAIAEAKCGACHPGGNKKERNDYGLALAKLLGEKNVMDAAKIKTAVKAAEGEKNAEGKTFGELLKSGKLPGSK